MGEFGHATSHSYHSSYFWWHEPWWVNQTTWWRHQMETFSANWPFVRGVHRWPVNSPRQGQWRGALIFTLFYAWINGWVNNREVGDLRRHRAHWDVTMMRTLYIMPNVSVICFHSQPSPFSIYAFNRAYQELFQRWKRINIANRRWHRICKTTPIIRK